MSTRWVVFGLLRVFCGRPRNPKSRLEVVATLRPDSSRAWPLPTGCRRSSGARITKGTRAVHVRCERGAFVLLRRMQHCITCWVIPCAKIPAACIPGDVLCAAALSQTTFTKVEADSSRLQLFVTCNVYWAGPCRLALGRCSVFLADPFCRDSYRTSHKY